MVEHHYHHSLLLDALGREHGVGPPAPVLGAEESLLDPAVSPPDRAEGARLFFRSGEEAEDAAHRLELGRRVIPQQSGERAVGGQESAVAAEETETDWSTIGEGAKQTLGASQSILYPPPCRHCLLEVAHLLAQAGDLMDQLLLWTVLVAHGKV